MNAHTTRKITPAMVPANRHDLLAALAQVEGDSELGLLAEAIMKGSNLRFDMRVEDIETCEVYTSTVGDLAYALEEKMQSEIEGWAA